MFLRRLVFTVNIPLIGADAYLTLTAAYILLNDLLLTVCLLQIIFLIVFVFLFLLLDEMSEYLASKHKMLVWRVMNNKWTIHLCNFVLFFCTVHVEILIITILDAVKIFIKGSYLSWVQFTSWHLTIYLLGIFPEKNLLTKWKHF